MPKKSKLSSKAQLSRVLQDPAFQQMAFDDQKVFMRNIEPSLSDQDSDFLQGIMNSPRLPGSKPQLRAPGPGVGPGGGGLEFPPAAMRELMSRIPQPGPTPEQTARGGLVGVGATVGSFLGAPAGPVGFGAGGIGGAAIGSLTADAFGLDTENTPEGHLGPTRRALGEGALEALFVGLPISGQAVKRLTLKSIARANEGLVALGEKTGIPMTLEAVSGSKLLTAPRNVLGKFPWFNKPFADEVVTRQENATQVLSDTLDELVPINAIYEGGLGKAMARLASGKFQFVKEEMARLYKTAGDLADSAGATVEPNVGRAKAQTFLDEIRSGASRIVTAKDGTQTFQRIRIGKSVVPQIADDIANLTPEVTFKAMRGLVRDINREVQRLKGKAGRDTEIGQLLDLKAGLEVDMQNVSDPAVAEALRAANAFTHSALRQFETNVAKVFEGTNRNIFALGFQEAGGLEAEALAKAAFNGKSRTAIRDLRELVGPRAVHAAARLHVNDAMGAAMDINGEGLVTGLNIDKMAKALGLGRGFSNERAALDEAFRGSGVKVQDLENLFRAMEGAFKVKTVSVSDFVARRAVIGGGGSALRSFAPKTSRTGPGGKMTAFDLVLNVSGMLTTVIGLRKFGRTLTDPRVVKDLTRAFSPDLSDAARQAIMLRMSRTVPDTWGAEALATGQQAALGSIMTKGGSSHPSTFLQPKSRVAGPRAAGNLVAGGALAALVNRGLPGGITGTRPRGGQETAQ